MYVVGLRIQIPDWPQKVNYIPVCVISSLVSQNWDLTVNKPTNSIICPKIALSPFVQN